jgi:hypothetical protein
LLKTEQGHVVLLLKVSVAARMHLRQDTQCSDWPPDLTGPPTAVLLVVLVLSCSSARCPTCTACWQLPA